MDDMFRIVAENGFSRDLKGCGFVLYFCFYFLIIFLFLFFFFFFFFLWVICLAEGEELVLGRGINGIEGAQVSRRQLCLRVAAGRLQMEVAGQNASLLNGSAVQPGQRVQLRHGDTCDVLKLAKTYPFRVEAKEKEEVGKHLQKREQEEEQQPSSTKRSRESSKEPCKYGAACYQKNADHLERFSHPGRDEEKFAQPATKKQLVSAAAAAATPVIDAAVAVAASSGSSPMPGSGSSPTPSPPKAAKAVAPVASSGGAKPTATEGSAVLTFGKHAGKTFEQMVLTEPGYCKWVLDVAGPSELLLPFQLYLRGMKPKDTAPSTQRNETLAREWNDQVDLVRPKQTLDAKPVVSPFKPEFGKADTKFGRADSKVGKADREDSTSSSGVVSTVHPILAVPLLGVGATLQVDSKLGVRVCAEAINAFLSNAPDAEVLILICTSTPLLRDSLAALLRDSSRSRVVVADGVSALSSQLSATEQPSFVALETSWRMAPVPKTGFSDLARLLGAGASAGKTELMNKMKAAVTVKKKKKKMGERIF